MPARKIMLHRHGNGTKNFFAFAILFLLWRTLLVKNRPPAYLLWVLKRKLKPASPVNSLKRKKIAKTVSYAKLHLIHEKKRGKIFIKT